MRSSAAFPLIGSCARLRTLKISEGVQPFVGWCVSAQRFQKSIVSSACTKKHSVQGGLTSCKEDCLVEESSRAASPPDWSPHRSCAAPTPPEPSPSGCGITGSPAPTTSQTAIIKEWADKEKVDVKIDYITSQGNKLLLTLAAEAQAKSGHDIMEFTNWESAQHNAALEPVDDVVKRVVATQRPDRSRGGISRQVRRHGGSACR